MPDPTCFIAMPLTTPADSRAKYLGDAEHFMHTLDYLFVPAVEAAGFAAIRPVMSGADVIQGQIIKHLETADMVLCDISAHNPNVFFELGIRTALDRPVALVRDNHTEKLPFDTSIVNTHTYDSSLSAWTLEHDRHGIAQHLKSTWENTPDRNDLWGFFGLTRRASERLPSENPLEAKVDLMMSQLSNLSAQAEFSVYQHDSDEFIDRVLEEMSKSRLPVLSWTSDPQGATMEIATDSTPQKLEMELARLSKKYRRTLKIQNTHGKVLYEVHFRL